MFPVVLLVPFEIRAYMLAGNFTTGAYSARP